MKKSPAKVYFTNMRTKNRYNLLDKLDALMVKAGIEEIDFKNQFTAIKLHFGEPGNLAYIRPDYAARVVNKIRELGGRPFLTDCNVLYWGFRGNTLDHLQTANEHGFNPLSTGAHVIIADGLTGGEYEEIPINLKHVKNAKVGSTLAHAGRIVSLTHFKGHGASGFGGVLKNIGMGGGSRQGKLEMHSSSKPKISVEKCMECGVCIKYCPQEAIDFNESHKAQINYDLCIGCGQCVVSCHYGAVRSPFDESAAVLNEKIAEYTYAVLKDKLHFHISLIMNISPTCDCWGYNDLAVVPDLGMAASFDPVALDRACVDLVNQAPQIPGSEIVEKNWKCGDDKFNTLHPDTNWQAGLDHAEKIGLGTQNYKLITVN